MGESRETWIRNIGIALISAVVLLLIWQVRGMVITVLMAVVCAYVLRPLVLGLSQPALKIRGRVCQLPRSAATGIVFILIFISIWLIGKVAIRSMTLQIDEFQARWPAYQEALSQFASDLNRYYHEQLPSSLRRTVDEWVAGASDLILGMLKKALGLTVHGVGIIIELLFVPILTFYFLADGPAIRKQLLFFVPRRHLARTEIILNQMDRIFQQYIKAQIILCLIAFIVVGWGLYAIGIDFYLLLGILAGVTRAIPIIGPLAGAIPILIVVALTKSASITVWVLILFSLMHFLESKLLMPAILGQQLEIHPALIIFSLLIGAQLGGILGLFVAAPLLAAIKTVVAQQRSASTRIA